MLTLVGAGWLAGLEKNGGR